MYEGDTVKLVRSVRPEVAKYGFDPLRGATAYVGEPMKWVQFLSYARQFKARGRATPATAPKEVLLLDVLDQAAAVKVTAWWGTDYLLLGRYDGRWMISHVLWQSAAAEGTVTRCVSCAGAQIHIRLRGLDLDGTRSP